VKRLPLKSGETYSGDASEGLIAAEAFKFLEAKSVISPPPAP